MAEVLRNVRKQYGPVTSIVHGAGNIADKRIEQKVDKDFASVVDTKVKGLENVLRHVDLTKLRRMLLFSSISYAVFCLKKKTEIPAYCRVAVRLVTTRLRRAAPSVLRPGAHRSTKRRGQP